jgi:hypothetical protein
MDEIGHGFLRNEKNNQQHVYEVLINMLGTSTSQARNLRSNNQNWAQEDSL